MSQSHFSLPPSHSLPLSLHCPLSCRYLANKARDKHEGELKKQILKLGRLRDDLRDKMHIVELRDKHAEMQGWCGKVEEQMQRFFSLQKNLMHLALYHGELVLFSTQILAPGARGQDPCLL